MPVPKAEVLELMRMEADQFRMMLDGLMLVSALAMLYNAFFS